MRGAAAAFAICAGLAGWAAGVSATLVVFDVEFGEDRSTWDMEECESRITWVESNTPGSSYAYLEDVCWQRATPDRPAGLEEKRGAFALILFDNETKVYDSWTQWPEDE